MNKKQLLTVALVATMVLTITACGNVANTEQTSDSESESTSEATQEENENDIFAESKHDTTEKENSYESAIAATEKVTKGSTDYISGKYTVNGATYTFDNDTATIVMDGKYEYEITETDEGFNLMADGTLLPLVYMSGTDGLTSSDSFDGVYSMGSQGYVFTSNGSLTVVNVYDDLEVDKDSIAFTGQTYDYRSESGKIILSSNGTDVMTLVP